MVTSDKSIGPEQKQVINACNINNVKRELGNIRMGQVCG